MAKKFIKARYDANALTKRSSMLKKNVSGDDLRSERYASSNTIFTQPHFYSPLHTPQNWQIPSKRKEQYQWARFFFENEPKVGAAIQFYTEYPLQGFELQCGDIKIKKYFEQLVKKLDLEYWLPLISSEYFMLGDVFPFLGIECKKCGGTGVLEGERCDHEGGTFNKIVVLNPDWIEVKKSPLDDEPYIQLIPDEELKRVVMDKFPLEMYNRIPNHLRQMIISGQPIPLSNRAAYHLKHMPAPYGTYGSSIIRRLFKILAYKDRLMTANWIVAERLILPIRIVKIGNDDRPAGANDIANVQQQLAAVQNDPNLTLVTHHAFDYSFVGAQGSIVQLQAEYEMITKEILDGVMLPQAVLNAEMQGYQGVQIGAEILIKRLENWRGKLKRYIEDRIFLPEAKMQGFIDEEESKILGETIYKYPKIEWNDLNIRDDTQKKQQYLGLHDAGILSTQTLMEIFDLDYDQEIERRREEASIQMSLGGGQGMQGGGMGGMPPMGGGGMPPMGGGGMPPMGDMGGGMPGGDMGGMGGGMPGGDMGGGGMPPMGAPAAASSGGKIMKRKDKRKIEADADKNQQYVMPEQIELTSLERTLWKKLFNDPALNIPFQKFSQYQVHNHTGQAYRLDFAIPQLKIGIEVDGKIWHDNPEKKARDQNRDSKLAKRGWMVLRFSEDEIQSQIDEVTKTISNYVSVRTQQLKQPKKKASTVLNRIHKTLDSIGED
jgi:very-short-patch-repair endonuclease